MTTARRLAPLFLVPALGLTGCGGGSDDAAYVPPAPDREAVVLPWDEFTVSPRSQMEEAYVRDLLIEDCMAGHGVDVPAVRPDHLPTEEEGAARAVQFGIQTPAHAAEAGYRIALSPELRAEYDAWTVRREIVETMTEAEYALFNACYEEGTRGAEDLLDGTLYPLQHGGQVAVLPADALLDRDVLATLDPWHECVVAGGLDVPVGTTPREMPTDAYREQVKASPDPWAEERRVAAIDTGCREEVGFGPAHYQALFDSQIEAIESNYAELVETRDQIHTIGARLDEVIAELEAAR